MQCTDEERYVVQSMTGYAFPGCELRVVDAEDNDVARDGATMGESLRSDGVMAGSGDNGSHRRSHAGRMVSAPETWP